jgi:membrane-bound ClpP family serine protease
MWIIAGFLLGLVCLASVIGFHVGPHTHVAAGVLGALAAGWLTYMMVARGPGPVLWSLLGVDLVVGAGMGALAWKGIERSSETSGRSRLSTIEGAEGIAVSELAPEGIVRVRGQLWSAVSVNGKVAASTRVEVVRAMGVRLEVWGDVAESSSGEDLFRLDRGAALDRQP